MRNGKRIHIEKIAIERLYDSDPDTSYLEQEGFEDRLDQYKRDVFSFIGIRAVAEISITCETSNTIQHITSGGLWGIESDSPEKYLKEIEQTELDELCDQLHALSISKRAISAAFREVSR